MLEMTVNVNGKSTKLLKLLTTFKSNLFYVSTGAFWAVATSRHRTGSTKMMQPITAPAPQHLDNQWLIHYNHFISLQPGRQKYIDLTFIQAEIKYEMLIVILVAHAQSR
jgi:hypothetical protein